MMRVFVLNLLFGIVMVTKGAYSTLGATNNTQITIPFRCGGLGYDATTGVFYATAKANPGSFSNCLVSIAPLTGGISLVTNLDAEPGVLFLSPERRALYFSIPGQNAVRRYDLASKTLGPAFDVGGQAKQLILMPGTPERVALIRKADLSVGLYENGAALPSPSDYDYVSLICNGADGSRLYGYNLNTTAYTFYRFSAGANGLSLLDGIGGLFPLPGLGLQFAGGLLYSGDGWVADPEAKTLIGQFPVQASGIPLGQVTTDLARNRVYVLQPQWPDSPIYACETNSYRLVATGVVSNTTWGGAPFTDEAYVRDFQRWGEDGFACRTYDYVLITRSPLIPAFPARDIGLQLIVTNASVTNLQMFNYLIACTNLGPVTATNAIVRLVLPPETTFVSATNNRGPVSVTNNLVSCTLTNLLINFAGSIVVKVKVQTTNVAALVATASLSSPYVDPNEFNNHAVVFSMANWRAGLEVFNAVSFPAASDAGYAAVTGRFYFLFNRNAGELANFFVGFDPVNGVFDSPLALPPDPQKMLLTTDGLAMEAALGIPNKVCRLDLATLKTSNYVSAVRWQEIQAKTELQKDQGGISFTYRKASDLLSGVTVGSFPDTPGHVQLFQPDTTGGRFFQFYNDDGNPVDGTHLRIFDLSTYRALQNDVLPVPFWGYSALTRWGQNGLLARSPSGFLVWQSRFIPGGAATDLQISIKSNPAMTNLNRNFTLLTTVTNAGSNPATNVTVRVWLPVGFQLISVTNSAGTLASTSAPIVLNISQLKVTSNATVTVIARATNTGSLLSAVQVSSQNIDTNNQNDFSLCSTVITNMGGWPAVDNALVLPLSVNDLVYEPVSQRLYASIGSTAGIYGNSVIGINPLSGSIESCFYAGVEPGRLAATDDGQFLYVSDTGSESVRRLRLADGLTDLQFTVGTASDTHLYYAKDIACQPGHPDTVALLRAFQGVTPSTFDLCLYQNGQRLAKSISAFDIQVIAFNETGDKLFGYGNEVSDFLFSLVNVSSNGVSLNYQRGGMMAGFYESFRYEAGLIFGTMGIVFDPITQMPRGLLPGTSSSSGGVAPHTAAGRVYGMAGDGTNAILRSYELDHMTFLNESSVKAPTDYPHAFQRCGSNRLAYCTASSVVIISSSLVLSGPLADLGLSFAAVPLQAPLGVPYTISLTLTNSGPQTITDCWVGIALPEGVSLLSADCAGSWWFPKVWYLCVPPALASGQSINWSLTLENDTPGLKLLQAFTDSSATDPHASNDVATAFIPTGTELATNAMGTLPIPVRTLVYSPARRQLYAAVPAGVADFGNTVIEIDPATGRVRGPLFVGSEPVAIAVSDDGHVLYVSVFGMGAVRRINLDNWTVESIFSAGAEVGSAVALLDSTSAVALSHGGDATVYNNGVRTAYLNGPITQLIRGDGNRIYGFNSSLPTMPIVNLVATAGSLAIQGQWSGPFFTAGVDLRFAGGKIFSNRGDVLNAETQSILGQFTGFGQMDAFVPEIDGNRLYTLQAGNLKVWNTANWGPMATTSLTATNATVSSLLRWGADGLAYLENDYPVWLRSNFVQTPAGTDSDLDGMPDFWELAHDLNPNLASDALSDPDQDGLINRGEYIAGRDPQFAEGPLRLFVGSRLTDGVVMRFAGQSGHHYRIERATALSPADWQTVATGLVGQGTMISYTCQLSGVTGFLRIIDETTP